MLAHTFAVVIALTGAGLAAAQPWVFPLPHPPNQLSDGYIDESGSPVGLTSSCSTTLQNLLTSPDAECLNLGSLLSFAVIPDESIPQAIDVWLTNLCGTRSCTDSNIANVVANLTQGCAEEFSNLGIGIAGLQNQITTSVQQAYPTIRRVACLQDTTTNELCATQTLNNAEQMFGKFVVDGSLTVDILNQDVQTFLNSNLTQIACTSCVQAAYDIGIAAFPTEVSEANSTLEFACGTSFLDGRNVRRTDVAQPAFSSRSPVNANSGFTWEPFTLASRGLLALLGASVVLA